MKTNKKYIDTYKTIYGVDLVVASKNVTTKDLQKKYTCSNGEELKEDNDNYTASTTCCQDKYTGRYVILVQYYRDSPVKGVDKKLDFINTCSHEATHVAMDIYSYIGEKVFPEDSNELLANLIGWATECIYKTWTKK